LIDVTRFGARVLGWLLGRASSHQAEAEAVRVRGFLAPQQELLRQQELFEANVEVEQLATDSNELYDPAASELASRLVTELHETGSAKLKSGDLDGAIAAFSEAIELNPEDRDAYLKRARAKSAKDDLDGAIADFTRVIELDPKNYNAYDERADEKFLKNDLNGALADYNCAIELFDKQARTFVELSAVLDGNEIWLNWKQNTGVGSVLVRPTRHTRIIRQGWLALE
jgi:tetratricopeptide (TPR) repeat protein